jgi:hypothetical protein
LVLVGHQQQANQTLVIGLLSPHVISNGCKNNRTHRSYWRASKGNAAYFIVSIYRKKIQFINIKSEEPLKNLKTPCRFTSVGLDL